jgi:hypothetical protein
MFVCKILGVLGKNLFMGLVVKEPVRFMLLEPGQFVRVLGEDIAF